MAVPTPTAAEFITFYPEFGQAPLAVVNAKLAIAARHTAADVYADTATQNDAVFLQAAVLLAMTPDARKLQLVDAELFKTWKKQLRDYQRSAVVGIRVP